MRDKWLYTIRWRLLLAMLTSAAATGLAVFLCYSLSEYILTYRTVNKPLTWIVNSIGSVPVMAVTGVVLFLIGFFLMTGRIVREMRQVERGLLEIAGGRFGHVVPVRRRDELGALAEIVNRISGQWERELDEMNHGLREIAKGRLDHAIPVRSGSKLGEVADSINRMSAQLRASIEEERRTEQTKNDLITGVSHDLRTPLTSILGFLEVIEEDRCRDETEMRYYVNIAYEKSLALKQLIDDLFEYTRIDNGLPLELAELSLEGFIRQLAEEFVPALEQAGMECRVDAHEDGSRLKILADGNLLVRAYENLLANAIQYGQDGKFVDIDLRREGDEVAVTVTNYGDPIPERDLPFIFDRFYRADRSRSRRTGGTGLGLAITKSIVEVHGGTITARSRRAATSFETRFPAAPPADGRPTSFVQQDLSVR